MIFGSLWRLPYSRAGRAKLSASARMAFVRGDFGQFDSCLRGASPVGNAIAQRDGGFQLRTSVGIASQRVQKNSVVKKGQLPHQQVIAFFGDVERAIKEVSRPLVVAEFFIVHAYVEDGTGEVGGIDL